MRYACLTLAVLASAAGALEPAEIYDRAAPGTVYVIRKGATGSGAVVDLAGGLILTDAGLVEGVETVDVRIKDDVRLPAKVVARDGAVRLALLQIPNLAETRAKEIPLAPETGKDGGLAGRRVHSVGHPVDPTDTLSMWKFTQGTVTAVAALPDEALGGLVLAAHDAKVPEGNRGAPLLDAEARLVGVTGAREGRAVPVNAIRAFLARTGLTKVPALTPDALPVFDLDAVRKGPAKKPAEPEPDLPAVEIPEGLSYGPYVHLLESKEKAALSRRVQEMVRNLRGLFYVCPRCKGKGSITEMVEPGRYLSDGTYIEPVYQTKTCPRCEGDKKLFREDRATTTFHKMMHRDASRTGAYAKAQKRWVERCHASNRTYNNRIATRIEVQGIWGTVHGSRNNPLFPLHFKLHPKGTKYEWYLHDDRLSGPFLRDRNTAPGHARILEVAAGDTLILEGGSLVRLCGIAVAGPGGKVPRRDIRLADEEVRQLVRGELRGKMAELKRDKYTRMTCDGHPLVYVYIDGADYGEGLLRRGIVRKHPRHKCARYGTYLKAETEAKKAGLGIWAKD